MGCHPHPYHRIHCYKSTSQHLSSLLRQDPTHPNAQLSESDMHEFPATPRATHHSSPQDLASKPKFHANLLLHLYLTFYSQTLSTPLYHAQSFFPALRSTLYHSEFFHCIHPHTFWSSPVLSPFHPRFIHSLCNSFIVHSLDMFKPSQGTPLCSPWLINLNSYSSPNFFISDPISNCHTTCILQTFHFYYI